MHYIQHALGLSVLGIGIYMFTTSAVGTPPYISGIAFSLIGVAQIIHNYLHHGK